MVEADTVMQAGEPAPTQLADAAGADAGASKNDEPQKNASGEEEHIELHVRCGEFRNKGGSVIQQFLATESDVPLTKVFKQKSWGYVFVTLRSADESRFREIMAGVEFKDCEVVIGSRKGDKGKGAGKKRPNGDDNGEGAKRQKVGEDGNKIPLLKELRDSAKRNKKSSEGASIVQKAEPLVDYPYETQIAMKNTYVKTAVRMFTKLATKRCEELGRDTAPWLRRDWSAASKAPQGCCCRVEEPVGAPLDSIAGWRNKCEFTIGTNEADKVEVGFVHYMRADGSQSISGVEGVPLVPPNMQSLAACVREMIVSSGFQVFDRRQGVKTGLWRMVMTRINPAGEMLVMVQTTTVEGDERKRVEDVLRKHLLEAELGIISIYLQFNDEVTDAARPTAVVNLVHGRPRLEMPLCGLRIEIGPLSFFNPNTTTCKYLMEKAVEYLALQKTDVLLDIFAGVGTIGLCAAAHCAKVIGVEIVPEAVENAKANAVLNGITNAEFHCGKAEDLVPKIVGDLDPDLDVCAVVDPARAGLHQRVANALRSRRQVSRIVYISCNPESLAEDVAKMGVSTDGEEDDLVPVLAVAVDSFPQTLHVEMILKQERSHRIKDPRTSGGDAAAQAEGGQASGETAALAGSG